MVTKLERFLKKHSIEPAQLAKESGYSRQHLLRVRQGTMEPTRPCISRIVAACRRLTDQNVAAPDLFNLEGEPEPRRKQATSYTVNRASRTRR